MRCRRFSPRLAIIVGAVLAVGVPGLSGCRRQDRSAERAVTVRLSPAGSPLPPDTVRHTVYVPVYSALYLGLYVKRDTVDLSATVSVRNVSPRSPIVIEFARYYDSAGRHVRDYIDVPSELPPLATVEFVVFRDDAAGGPGANFLIGWAGALDVDGPLIEAVMVGQTGNAGISFTSQGRTVSNSQSDRSKP
jgi:hypothetical protein